LGDIKAVVLVGPTAVGKTELSLMIAGEYFEIVSADSVQVYKYLDIGSGKPTDKQRKLIKHYLIDVVNPDYQFTAGDYCAITKSACDDIEKKNRFPLFVGGTGLYIDSFLKGLSDIPPVDESIREVLFREVKAQGLRTLYQELLANDADFAIKIHPHDKQRIVRGLEVFRGTGKPISSFYRARKGHESPDTLYIGLMMERHSLKRAIDERVKGMMASGLIDEVIALREMGYGPELNSMKSIGYLQINDYINGRLKLNEAVEQIKVETKKYAKRQMTWFSKNKRIRWFKNSDFEKIQLCINQWLVKQKKNRR
jgi:tRNA dimethylallyltransferase